MRRNIIVVIALALISLLVWVVTSAFGKDPHAVPFMMVKRPAPAFSIKRLDTGEMVSLEQFKGKPIVLNFWATWCGPCAQEHPTLEWGAKRWKDQVVFLGMVFEDSEENTKAFLSRNGWSLTQLYDPKSTVAVDYAVAGVPETYFIDRSGTILFKYAEPMSQAKLAEGIAEITK